MPKKGWLDLFETFTPNFDWYLKYAAKLGNLFKSRNPSCSLVTTHDFMRHQMMLNFNLWVVSTQELVFQEHTSLTLAQVLLHTGEGANDLKEEAMG